MAHRLVFLRIFLSALLINVPFIAAQAASHSKPEPVSEKKLVASAVTPPLAATTAPGRPLLTPTPPSVNAKGYFLVDAYSGKVLASNNADQRLAPASLTKMMTSYIVSHALQEKRIQLNSLVLISTDAWKTGGSKMFVKVGDQVPVQDLLQGIIVDSGNDACVAMAEFLAGSQESFVHIMNQQAVRLGMTGTHFMNVDGLPDPNHYTTPRDMAILARALVFDFPEDYKWYSQKWFTYNNIKQPNRNRLLWRDASVDGIKTGHTDEAGYCLVASAQRNGTRLISVLMGAPTDAVRADDNQKLLTYGFRFFQTRQLYPADKALTEMRVWQGALKKASIGLANGIYVTTPVGYPGQVKAKMTINSPLLAPLKKGQQVGVMEVTLNGDLVVTAKLVALQDDPKGNLWRCLVDKVTMYFYGS